MNQWNRYYFCVVSYFFKKILLFISVNRKIIKSSNNKLPSKMKRYTKAVDNLQIGCLFWGSFSKDWMSMIFIQIYLTLKVYLTKKNCIQYTVSYIHNLINPFIFKIVIEICFHAISIHILFLKGLFYSSLIHTLCYLFVVLKINPEHLHVNWVLIWYFCHALFQSNQISFVMQSR